MIESANSTDIVIAKNLSKRFRDFIALDNISFTIRQGEIFGYIGPNGAGKTTTMKILVGLISDFQGEVFVGRQKVGREKTAINKLLGYLPQGVAFQDWRTVNHALSTFGKLSGLTDEEVKDKIPQLLDLFNLSEVKHKKISQLSGGMIQKVGLAQALLHDPKFLILDEPLSGLDPLSRHQFKEILSKLKNNGTTILFSSHILSDVEDIADRIGIINRGRIKQIGTLNELKHNLHSEKVVEIVLSNSSDKWHEFKSISKVKNVDQTSLDRVLVYLADDANEDQVIDDIVQTIAKLKIKVRGIRLLTPSLDEIYLNYIQGRQVA